MYVYIYQTLAASCTCNLSNIQIIFLEYCKSSLRNVLYQILHTFFFERLNRACIRVHWRPVGLGTCQRYVSCFQNIAKRARAMYTLYKKSEILKRICVCAHWRPVVLGMCRINISCFKNIAMCARAMYCRVAKTHRMPSIAGHFLQNSH